MSGQFREFAIATTFLLVGSLILTNLKALANLDQGSGLKAQLWFKKNLGAKSPLNAELYSVGTPGGLKKSKAGFIAAGVFCVVAGLFSLGIFLINYMH